MTVIFLPRPSHRNTFRHIEPKWTCSQARFTLVANRTANAFAVHWTGQVKITPLYIVLLLLLLLLATNTSVSYPQTEFLSIHPRWECGREWMQVGVLSACGTMKDRRRPMYCRVGHSASEQAFFLRRCSATTHAVCPRADVFTRYAERVKGKRSGWIPDS